MKTIIERLEKFKYSSKPRCIGYKKKKSTGTSINLTDAIEGETKLTLYGNSYQETRSGKNKLSLPNTTESTLNGITSSASNGILTLNGTNSQTAATNVVKCSISDLSSDSDMSYTVSYLVVNGTKNVQLGISFRDADNNQLDYIQDTNPTALSTTKTISIDVLNNTSYLYLYVRSQEQMENLQIKVQLEPGDTATEYEEYGASPSPDYPSDIEVVKAHNLYNENTTNINYYIKPDTGELVSNTVWNTSDFIEVSMNTDYILSGKQSGSSAFAITEYDENKQFIIRNTASSSSNSNHFTITTTSTTKYVRISYRNDRITDEIQLVKGTILKPYVPYKNIGVKTTGKNLFTLGNETLNNAGVTTTINGSEFILNGTTTNEGNLLGGIRSFGYFPAGTYKFSIKIVGGSFKTADGGTFAIYLKDGNKTNIKTIGVTSIYDYQTIITLTEEMNLYMQMYSNLANIGGVFDNCVIQMQIEKSDSFTEYETYQETITYIDLQDNEICKVGDIEDNLKIKDGQVILTKNIEKIVLNGSENISFNYNHSMFRVSLDNLKPRTSELIPSNNVKSNYFENHIYSEMYNSLIDYGIEVGNSGEPYIYIRNKNITTIDEFKTWLSENNVTVYYQLAEPYEVNLGEIKMPRTINNVTNISLLATLETNMSLKYVQSTNIVVNNLAKAIVALGGEL